MPPTVAFGSAGYSGRPVVVNEAQYVFVPTNRFVGTNVTSVRVEPRRNAEIFRQAKPVTRFEVSGGVVRNMAVPVATVQRAMGSKIETREISTANTTPRTVSSGGVARSGRVAIVAPARDVKAARASRQTAAPATPQQHQQQAQPQRQAPQQQQQAKQQQAQPQHQPPQQQQQAKQQQAQPQRQAPQQQQQAKQQQAQPQHQPPQQQPKVQPQQGREKAMPASEEQGKDRGKKDQPGGEERPR
jgi:hypothetical protein